MFGHHKDSYAFGHGVDKFPAWMESNHPDTWRGFTHTCLHTRTHTRVHTRTTTHTNNHTGFKRLVGNRAQIFLENSVTMYYMATYYLKYCKFILLEAKAGNKLHKRLDEKLRSSEMLAG